MAEFQTPIRPPRILECPPAPRHLKRRPSFFENFQLLPKTLVLDDIDLDEVKIRMVKNYLEGFPSGTFRHNQELSKKIVETLKCKCERIDDDNCIYSK